MTFFLLCGRYGIIERERGVPMRIDWNKKYLTIAVYAVLVVIVSIMFYFFIQNLEWIFNKIKLLVNAFSPFVTGAVLAYLVNLALEPVEDMLLPAVGLGDWSARRKRRVSMVMVYVLLIGAVYLFVNMILPQLVSALTQLVIRAPSYQADMTREAEKLLGKMNFNQAAINDARRLINDGVQKLIVWMEGLLPVVIQVARSFLSVAVNFIVGFIISIYVLLDKERFSALLKKVLLAFLPSRFVEKMASTANHMDDIMKKFIRARVLDAIIVGFAFFVILVFMKVDFAGLIALILGVTNMLPWIGPWLGGIPAVFMILVQSPIKALWFILVILIVQQIDGNVIDPKIQSESLGISPFWILFAIILGGFFFGFPGMFIGVPLFVVVYSLIREWVSYRLEAKGLPVKTEDYLDDEVK